LTLLCLIWGFTVVADSAQFSAALSELTDRRYLGTALSVQTSLGFPLTFIPIGLIPSLADFFSREFVFMVLALAPGFGILSMMGLRSMPAALALASGKR